MSTQTKIPDYITQMYDENYNTQKAELDQNYQQGVSDLEQEQQKAKKQADENLTRTYVEAAKAAKNYGEVQNAYGLSSGAMAQAKLAQNNQLQGDLTSIRTAQQAVDADVEREKSLLAQQYMAAIAKARSENNMQKAQALYEAAKEEDDALLQKQQAAANLMAGVGDYSLIGQLYGLTEEQIAKLQGSTGGSSGGSGSSGNSGIGALSSSKMLEIDSYMKSLLGNTVKTATDNYQGSETTGDTYTSALRNAALRSTYLG